MNVQTGPGCYEAIRQGLLTYCDAIPIGCEPPTVVNSTIKAVLDSNPQLFWFEGKWMREKTGEGYCMIPQYSISRGNVENGKQEIAKTTQQILQKAGNSGSAQNALRNICQWLLAFADYRIPDGSQGQTIYDALVLHGAVCKGLSKTIQFCANQLEIPISLCETQVKSELRHVWNRLLDGEKYYNIDLSLGYPCFSAYFPSEKQWDGLRCFYISDAQLYSIHEKIGIAKGE